MAGLTNTTIAGSYERLLILPANGLNGTNLVAITDGDSDTACSLSVSTNKAKISGSLEITTSPLSFDGAATIDTSGNNLLTLQGATAGVRIDDFLGIDTAPNVNYGVKNLRTTTATGNAAGVIAQESVTLPSTANHYSSLWADAVITNVSSATAMAKVSAVRTGAFDVALASGSRTITNLAGVYVGGPPTTSGSGTTTVTNGPYSIFVDAGDCRFDGSVGIGIGSPAVGLDVHWDNEISAGFGRANDATNFISIRTAETANNLAGIAFMVGSATQTGVSSPFQMAGVTAKVINADNSASLKGELGFYTNSGDSIVQKMVIDKDGKVGIGTPTPDSTLHIHRATAGTAAANATTSPLVVENDTHSFIQFFAPTNRSSGLYFGSPSGNQYRGEFGYDNTNDKFQFYAAEAKVCVIDSNSAISLSNLDTGTSNTIFGKNAGDLDGAGDYNVFIGELAGGHGTQTDACDHNVGVGYDSLNNLTTGKKNTAVGYQALTTCSTGEENVAIGRGSLDAAVSASYNIAIGTNALGTVDDGETFNIAIGYDAMGNANLSNIDSNIAIGGYALDAIGANAQAGTIGIGHQALSALTSGDGNVAVGYQAAAAITTGDRNVALGFEALKSMTLGDDNICIGYQAGGGVTTGGGFDQNIFIGSYSGDTITSQDCVGNVGIGHATLTAMNNAAADDNIAIGRGTGGGITEGYNNTLIGKTAGPSITTGNSNVIIGALADVQNAASVKRIVIGSLASSASEDTTLYIGDNTNFLQYAYTGSGGVTISSDVRIKKNIRDTDLGLDFVNKLRPVKYNMRYPKDWGDGLAGENPEDYGEDYDKAEWDGFVAQEVKAAMDSSGVSFTGWEVEKNDDFENPRQRLAYSHFVIPLVKAVQELSAQNEVLAAKVEALENA